MTVSVGPLRKNHGPGVPSTGCFSASLEAVTTSMAEKKQDCAESLSWIARVVFLARTLLCVRAENDFSFFPCAKC